MPAVNSSTILVRFFDGVEITSYLGEEDNAKVIQIDTENDEHVRVNLNDAALFDGSPERNEPATPAKTRTSVVEVTLAQLEALAENTYADTRGREDLHWTQLSRISRLKRINIARSRLGRAGILVEK